MVFRLHTLKSMISLQDSGLSAGAGSSGGGHDSLQLMTDMESSLLSGIVRTGGSITTPTRPVQTQVLLESNPSVILNKKTLRNYTPRESSCLLRQFEEERLYSKYLQFQIYNIKM